MKVKVFNERTNLNTVYTVQQIYGSMRMVNSVGDEKCYSLRNELKSIDTSR